MINGTGRARQAFEKYVDRARPRGKADEPWWFEEVEMRGLQPGRGHFAFTFDLDDGGLWTVELVERHATLWPVRIERRQG